MDDETRTLLETIARETLDVPTLDDRGRDRLDFHDVHVASLRKALEAAYEAGRASVENAR